LIGTAQQRQPWPVRFRLMRQRARDWAWLLLSGLLVGCAAAPYAVGPEATGCDEQPASFEEVCYQQDALLAVCSGTQCAMYRCRQVAEYLRGGQVVRAQAVPRPVPRPPPSPRPLPEPRGDSQRYWGSAQGVPQPVLPVFIIPWNKSSPPLLVPGELEARESREESRTKPYEKHHIYPQAPDLKNWFEKKGINIHQWTLALEVEDHRRIHRGPNGGPWNEAWRRFQKDNDGATKLEIELHAGKLIYEFNLYGVVVPYSRQLLRLPSNVLEPD
jgi:uncharacterized lipoprotein (TIGR02269 family)